MCVRVCVFVLKSARAARARVGARRQGRNEDALAATAASIFFVLFGAEEPTLCARAVALAAENDFD